MKFVLLFSIVLFLATSCEESSNNISSEEDIVHLPDTLFSSSVLDSTILITDSFSIVFNEIGNPDNHIMIKEAEYSQWYSNTLDNDSNLLIEYVPKYGFLGIDTVEAVFTRTDDVLSHFTYIDSVKLIIRVVENEYHRQLIGRWKLVHYNYGPTNYAPEEGITTIVEYDNNMQYRQYRNDSLVFDLRYEMGGTSSNDSRYFYIDFEDGDTTTCLFPSYPWLRSRSKAATYWANWIKEE